MSLIPKTAGYASAIGIFIIICGLYVAKSWLHKKCKALLVENSTSHTKSLIDTATATSPQQEITFKNQQYFTSQIFPQSTLQLQIYVTTIDHYIVSIKTPLIQIAITVLLYTYSNSELVNNYNANNYEYIIIFHLLQLLSLCTFYGVSNYNPGIITPHPAPGTKEYDAIKPTKDPIDLNDEKDEKTNLLSHDHDDGNGSTGSTGSGLILGTFGNGRYQHIRSKNTNSSNSNNKQHPIEIECEWNNDSTVPISYCYNCYFLHPIRAKHCYEIGFCVARYDHYCKLIENAVGAYNLRFVIFHLLLDSSVYIWQLCMIIYIIILNISTSFSDIIGWILLIFTSFYLLISSLIRTIHLFDHIQTISKNQTISEKVDPQRTVDVLNDGYHDYDEDDREIDYHDRYFDEGIFQNWWLCVNGYKQNKEYFNGIKCKLMFDDNDHNDNTIFLQ